MNLSHEHRFLISCALSRDNEDLLNRIKNISLRRLDWEDVLASAFWHGVDALIYFNLIETEERLAVPENIMDRLKASYYRNIARNTYLYAELNNILGAFQRESVDVILLKGLALGKTVYKDSGTRKIGDIDLLVKEEDLFRAEAVMTGLGYLSPEHKDAQFSREKDHHINYEHPGKNVPVEIHWHISHKFHPGQIMIQNNAIISHFWERARTVTFGNRAVKILCPEELLIHLSHHFIKHRFLSSTGFNDGFVSRGALMQICDIVRVLMYYKDEISWEILQSEAEECRLDKILYSTLHIAGELLKNDNVPPDKINFINPETFNKDIVSLMLKRIFMKEDSSGVAGYLVRSFGENTFISGIMKIYRTMFPSREVMSEKYAVPLSSTRLYLCYLRRPFDVFFKHKKIIAEIPRIKDDALLKRWFYSQDHMPEIDR